MELFYMMTGTNPQIFGKELSGNLSGAALQKIFLRPLQKANRYIKNMEVVTLQVLKCALALEGIKNVEISGEWKEANFETIDDISDRIERQKQVGIRSTESAVREINVDYTEDQIIEEVEKIKGDEPKIDFGFEG